MPRKVWMGLEQHREMNLKFETSKKKKESQIRSLGKKTNLKFMWLAGQRCKARTLSVHSAAFCLLHGLQQQSRRQYVLQQQNKIQLSEAIQIGHGQTGLRPAKTEEQKGHRAAALHVIVIGWLASKYQNYASSSVANKIKVGCSRRVGMKKYKYKYNIFV